MADTFPVHHTAANLLRAGGETQVALTQASTEPRTAFKAIAMLTANLPRPKLQRVGQPDPAVARIWLYQLQRAVL